MKKKILGLTLAFIFAFTFIMGPKAESVLVAGDDATSEGTYASSKFVFGNNVNVNSEVDGITIAAGNMLNTKGASEFGGYAGNTLSINTKVDKDLFAAGNSINVGSDAVIGRDAYIVGNSVKINSNIGGTLRVSAVSLDLSGITIEGNLYAEAGTITMDKDTFVKGNFEYNDDAVLDGVDAATINGERKASKSDALEIEPITFGDRVYSFGISAIAAFLVMVVLFKVLPNSKKRLDDTKIDASSILSSLLNGLVVLIVLPIVACIALITGIFTPLALIALALYATCVYLASIVTSYFVGREVLKRVFKQDNVYIELCVGILLVRLLSLIPYVGELIALFALLYGLGTLYKLLTKKEA